jgi:hypothetical protein
LPSPLNFDLDYPIVNDQEIWEPLELKEKYLVLTVTKFALPALA